MADRFKKCPHCGAHLDFGEKCDCEIKNEGAGRAVAIESVVDLKRQTEANNNAMRNVLAFMAPTNERS